MTILKFRSRPEFERNFGPYYENEFGFGNNTAACRNQPATNIKKTNDKYEIEMAVPGMKKENFDIRLENNVLKISYVSKESDNDSVNLVKYLRKEFKKESFTRHFVLPKSTHIDNIGARYENGLLTVVVPFEDPEKSNIFKSIQVN